MNQTFNPYMEHGGRQTLLYDYLPSSKLWSKQIWSMESAFFLGGYFVESLAVKAYKIVVGVCSAANSA